MTDRKIHGDHLSKVKGRKGIGYFKEILDEFSYLNDRFCKITKYADCAFGYTEMSNVALFASAANNLGYAAVCEPQVDKRSSDNKKDDSYGRADLYITDTQNDVYGEAKLVSTFAKNFMSNHKVPSHLKKAITDTENTIHVRGGENYDGLAILFVAMYVTQDEDEKALKKDFKGMMETLYEKSEIDGFGYYFPRHSIKNWAPGQNILGIATLIKSVK